MYPSVLPPQIHVSLNHKLPTQSSPLPIKTPHPPQNQSSSIKSTMIAVRPKQEDKMEVRLFAAKQYSTDDDSAGSSEELDSPRSVQGRWRSSRSLKKVAYVHSQILRIREEDSYLGESSFGVKEKVARAVASRVDFVLLARPVLPCSPLRNTVSALH